MNIINLIPLGEENAISRLKLMELTGFTDQYIRNLIGKVKDTLKPGDYFIVCTPHGKYYQTKNMEEVESYVNREIDSKMKTFNFRYRGYKEAINIAKGIKFTMVKEHPRRIGVGNLDGQISI